MPSEVVHLHVHTEFSLLDGQSKIGKLMARAKALDMIAVAITDHGVMFGVIDFYRKAHDAGIKPIIGMEGYLAPNSRFDRDPQRDKKAYHMLLLARDNVGYQNLLKLASKAQLEGYYYRPRFDRELLAQHSQGLIATTGCLAAEVARAYEEHGEGKAQEVLTWYLDVFGEDNFFLELQPHDIPELRAFNRWLIQYRQSGHSKLQLLATNDVHYVNAEDWDVHDTLLCIQTGALKSQSDRMKMSPQTSYYLKTADEMRREFSGLPDVLIREAFENTLRVADLCQVNLDTKGYHLPNFPIPPEFANDSAYLRHLCEMGLSWRYPNREADPVLRERLERELRIIADMGFNTYFLIVWDLCEFARYADIWWNVRGSGAGSLVAYCLGITNIDPIQNSLLFERFLNPGRVSMPDIDLDYPDDRRAEMIEYAVHKYGEDKVAAIITFGTMAAKGAIRDVGRVLNVELSKINQALKYIPTEPKPKKIPEYVEADPDLKRMVEQDEELKRVFEAATELQGMIRHASTHAAGVIISDKPLDEYLPLHRITSDSDESAIKSVTQFPMETAESIGLLKVDFLGLSTLTIMRKAAELIERHRGIRYTMDNIPYRHDDPRISAEQRAMLDQAFEMMGRGETVGVFQVESSGMQSMLRGMRPFRFEHIIAAISLYRPGPMDFIPTFNQRMHGQEEVKYLHPKLEPILKETYGIMVYQEQLMQIASDLFGYSLGEADLMRRAVSKKKQADLLKHKDIFKQRGPQFGVEESVAEAIFDEIEFFANYGFNKCVVGDTQIVDAQSGRLVTVQALFEGQQVAQTITYDVESQRLQHGPISAVMQNGVKPVYRLTTRMGRQITATANHPFLTMGGWCMLGDLSIGQHIATPRCLPVEGQRVWPDHEVIVLGHLLAEGKVEALPDEVFELRNAQLASLLHPVMESPHVLQGLSTRVAAQVRHLLLRLAVVPEAQVLQIAQASGLSATSTNDIYWDEIVAIESAGEQMTYDLTIPQTHNFVANDIIVHNSHASDYAVITVQTAYLKRHYPEEYMTALLVVQFDDLSKVSTFLEECRRLQIPVLPPDVNASQLDFDIEYLPGGKRAIRFGLQAIKNAAANALTPIIAERQQGGPFRDLTDFAQRVDLRLVGKRTLESLVRVGALDSLDTRRDALLENLDRIVGFSADYHKAKDIGQKSLFGGVATESNLILPDARQAVAPREQLRWERELLGLYVSGRPTDRMKPLIENDGRFKVILHLLDEESPWRGKNVWIAGEIVDLRRVHTKSGDQMVVLQIEDWHESGASIQVVIFPRTWRAIQSRLQSEGSQELEVGAIIWVSGKLDTSRDSVQIIADNLGQKFDSLQAQSHQQEGASDSAPAWMEGQWERDDSPDALPTSAPLSEAKASAPPPTMWEAPPPSPEGNLFVPLFDDKRQATMRHKVIIRLKRDHPERDYRLVNWLLGVLRAEPGHDVPVIVINDADGRKYIFRVPFKTQWSEAMRQKMLTHLKPDQLDVRILTP